MDGRTENLPILQDFVPYWSRCPKKNIKKKKKNQKAGKERKGKARKRLREFIR